MNAKGTPAKSPVRRLEPPAAKPRPLAASAAPSAAGRIPIPALPSASGQSRSAPPYGAASAAPDLPGAAKPALRLPSGVRRLDTLLNGGIPAGAAVLVYGPPFLGKEVLARRFFQANLEAGNPGVYVLTNAATAEVRAQMQAADPSYAALEQKRLGRFVDTYSRSIGAADSFKDAEYLDGALDLPGLSLAVNKAQSGIIANHDHHALILDSVSTLIAYTNAGTAFRFLQTLIGRTRRVGATGLFLLDHGMHSEADVQMFKHLMTGVIELRESGGKTQLQVQGLGAPSGHAWVDYRFDAGNFEITGSFAAGRIR